MKNTAIFRLLLVVTICSLLVLSACVKNPTNDKTDAKQNETVETTDLGEKTDSEENKVESSEKAEATTDKDVVTTQATTEEPETYEQLTDGPGIETPEVDI